MKTAEEQGTAAVWLTCSLGVPSSSVSQFDACEAPLPLAALSCALSAADTAAIPQLAAAAAGAEASRKRTACVAGVNQ